MDVDRNAFVFGYNWWARTSNVVVVNHLKMWHRMLFVGMSSIFDMVTCTNVSSVMLLGGEHVRNITFESRTVLSLVTGLVIARVERPCF